jgi:hypothetical protein
MFLKMWVNVPETAWVNVRENYRLRRSIDPEKSQLVVQVDAGPQFIFSKLPGVVPKTLPRNPTHTSVTF